MTTTDRLVTTLAERYRVARDLGQGGMATVYLARDLKHDRKVAVKVLKPELAAYLRFALRPDRSLDAADRGRVGPTTTT